LRSKSLRRRALLASPDANRLFASATQPAAFEAEQQRWPHAAAREGWF
jgi:hypothetical protein